MGMTATQLGTVFGRGAAAMNVLLKEHGFLEGGPGAWMPTELGKQFAQSHDFDNGYGGYAHRSWGWLSWGDGLVDALKASIEQHPEGVLPAAPSVAAAAVAAAKDSDIGPSSGKTKWMALAAIGVVAVAVPAAQNVVNRFAERRAAAKNAQIVGRTSVDAEDAVDLAGGVGAPSAQPEESQDRTPE